MDAQDKEEAFRIEQLIVDLALSVDSKIAPPDLETDVWNYLNKVRESKKTPEAHLEWLGKVRKLIQCPWFFGYLHEEVEDYLRDKFFKDNTEMIVCLSVAVPGHCIILLADWTRIPFHQSITLVYRQLEYFIEKEDLRALTREETELFSM